MKRLMMMAVCCLVATACSGQTWNEWFRQKNTQKKYLAQQILALKAYSEVIQKGYGIAREGLNVIGSITDGEFRLHDLFFNSLRNVSPVVGRYGRIADIIGLQLTTVRKASRQIAEIRRDKKFRRAEIDYLGRVFAKLLEDCSVTVDELIEVTTSGELELSDDARLKRIDVLYERTCQQHAFCEVFGQEAMVLAILRARELGVGDDMAGWYGEGVERLK
ncbi:hypothetical protein MKQ68_18870 [Chitinophaga horti]|uniref:Lipoprotein n=1 Tax=Chitinophaga horti TaxID=2920382 RepID=A0ABY6IXN6_9BACT|nr:hypothetical protein [Chitinophaga horti]UYQ92153.1 hypothetical protein MKQ68_18870 [Chitinophaga horti]